MITSAHLADLIAVRGRLPRLHFSVPLCSVRALDRAGLVSNRSALCPSTSRSLPAHLHHCNLICNILVVSSHHMTILIKAFLGDIILCGCWLNHCISPVLFVSDSVFPGCALSAS